MNASCCGCDKDTNWVCERHLPDAAGIRMRWGLSVYDPRIHFKADAPAEMAPKLEVRQFGSGMIRGATESKIDYTLPLDGPMFKRLAVHLTNGAIPHGGKRNWMNAHQQADLDRFIEGAMRHMLQWYYEETDEDHAAAVFFNVNGAEYVRGRMKEENPDALHQA